MKEKRKPDKDRFKLNETGVYIYGQRAAIIDGDAEIYEYSDKTVVFMLGKKNKYLTICGRSLTVRIAGQNVSEVCGHIDSVRFGEKDKKC